MILSILVPICLILQAACVLGQDYVPFTIDLNREPPQPQETICGDIIHNSTYPVNDTTTLFYYLASEAITCLTSVPFNAAVATRFLTYLNQVLQFQSSATYLSHPPAEYQQNAVDLLGGVQGLQQNVDSGAYRNQYAFEAAVQNLLQQAHDTHLVLYGGVTDAFTFSSPFALASVSKDGKETPEVYVYDDLLKSVTEGGYTASPIEAINGVPIVEYLTKFAEKNAYGMLEPHADWNTLMYSPAQAIIGGANSFYGGVTLYPSESDDGNDELNIRFANSTEAFTFWLAHFNNPGYTGPLTTGGDFYNYFALSLRPANFNDLATQYYEEKGNSASQFADPNVDTETISNSTSWNHIDSAYPADTISWQAGLGLYSSGFITGYMLESAEAAVISIPSFDAYAEAIDTFSSAIIDFVGNATNRHAKRVIIDLQQNGGGQISLAIDAYRLFFSQSPTPDRPFTGSRMRSHEAANILGDTATAWFEQLILRPDEENFDEYYYTAVSSEWVVTDRINAETGQNFTSWAEYYGPQALNGDSFSQTQVYNLSSQVFAKIAFDIGYPGCFFTRAGCSEEGTVQNWQPEDIIILTDSLCASACTFFVEMMKQEGVRSVVVGGRPETGAMQAASGTRGARAYDGKSLTGDYQLARAVNDSTASRISEFPEPNLAVSYLGFNLRDQIRQNSTVPNQFTYMPADCRIYWTLDNFANYTRLWLDAYNAIYTDTSICVPGSTNVASAPTRPQQTTKRSVIDHSTTSGHVSDYIIDGLTPGIPSTNNAPGIHAATDPTLYGSAKFCTTKEGKPNYSACLTPSLCSEVEFPCTKIANPNCRAGPSCPKQQGTAKKYMCTTPCTSGFTNRCSTFESCRTTNALNSAQYSVQFSASTAPRGARPRGGPSFGSGYCTPNFLGSNLAKPACTNLDKATEQQWQIFIQTGQLY